MGNDSIDDQMLTPGMIADYLGVHPKTVHLWLRTGRLHGIKISYRAWRVPRASFEEFLEKNRNVPAVPDPAPPRQEPAVPEDSGTKMKEYLQDIMREKSDGTHPES